MVKRLSDKQEIEGSIPSRCIFLGLYGGMVDAADSKFVTFWFVGSSPSTSNFKNIDSLMVERLSHNQEVEGSIPSRCIFLGVA